MPDKPLDPAEIRVNRERLRFVRPWLRYRGLSQRHVADALSVSEPTVSKWLNGTQTISIAQFFAIAELLGAKPEDILGGGPGAQGRGRRYRRLAELAEAMSDQTLDTFIAAGEEMVQSRKRPENDD